MKREINKSATKDFLYRMFAKSLRSPYLTLIAHKPIFTDETEEDFVSDELFRKKIVDYPLNANIDSDDEFFFIRGNKINLDDEIETKLYNEALTQGVEDIGNYVEGYFHCEIDLYISKKANGIIKYDCKYFEDFYKLSDYLIEKYEKLNKE